MTDWYAPNQQAVRADESGPAEEGNGGTVSDTPTPTPEPEPEPVEPETPEPEGDPEGA